jgi:membrane-associated phospholipid phosphatase
VTQSSESADLDMLPVRPLAIVAVICGVLFLLLAVVIAIHPAPSALDRTVEDHLVPASDESRQFEIAATGSDMGSPTAVVVAGVLLAAGCWWYTKRWRLALLLVAAPGIAGVLAETILKPMVGRPAISNYGHPSRVFSFPSGHAAGATGLAVAVVLVACVVFRAGMRRNVIIVVAALYALTVGVAQIVTSAHYATDVLGGALLGTCVAVSVALLLEQTPTRRFSASSAPT